jgi:hypothetical protein
MAVMPALTTRRRPLTIGLLVVAAVSLVLVGAALWNPWRLTALYPLATAGGAIATLTLAGAVLATAGVLALTASGRPAVIGVLVGLVAVPALCVGAPAVMFGGSFRDKQIVQTRALATSPDGDYSVVAVSVATDADPLIRLYVRSRQWLFSREAATPLAECAHDPFAGDVPPEAVRFTTETTVAVPIAGESTVTVTFDGASLAPQGGTIAMCPPNPPEN